MTLAAQTPHQSMDLWYRQCNLGYEDLPVVEDLRLFEVEMGGGVNLGRRWSDTKVRPGTNFILELRLNRPEPWDFALQFKGSNFTHRPNEGGADIKTTIIAPSLFVDYNIRPSRRTRFFAGVGFGGSFVDNGAVVMTGSASGFLYGGNESAFAVTPRVGVSLFNFLRLTAEYSITARDYSRFGLNVGIIFGGSYRSGYVDRRSGRQIFWEDVAPAIIDSIFPD
jgi:hypothetical protein